MNRFKLRCLLIWAVFPTFCLAEVLTQSFVIRLGEMEQLIREQKQTIEEQKEMIEDQTKMKEDIANLTAVTENLTADVYFYVYLDNDITVTPDTIITWNYVRSNVGGGYIDDAGSPDQYKFIAPINGTYQFTVTVMTDTVGGNIWVMLMLNENEICWAYSENEWGTGVGSTVVHMDGSDKIWVKHASFGSGSYEFHRLFTTFSGHLINADV